MSYTDFVESYVGTVRSTTWLLNWRTAVQILGQIKLIGLRINRNIVTKLIQIISLRTDRDNRTNEHWGK